MTYSDSSIAFPHVPEPPTILIVENDSGLRNLLKSTLETAGYPCEIVKNGQEALSFIHQHSSTPLLILSDFQMPKMDGLQLLQTLKQTPKTRGIPFILTTGNSSVSLRKQAMRDGALAILPKPYTQLELLQILNRAIASPDEISVLSENLVVVEERIS